MASKLGAQAKLNKVVKIIAEAMASEVCSIYLLRDGVLELFATLGLNQGAVHVTKLALGEGLVGTIAKDVAVLNLAEAASHPEFIYLPETGEELFHSFAGVPIIRKERAIGVLAVQHADPRAYDELEIEALQTVAMVLCELIANAGLADKARGRRATRAATPAPPRSPACAWSPAWAAASPSITSRACSSSIPWPTISRPSATAWSRPSPRCASRSTR